MNFILTFFVFSTLSVLIWNLHFRFCIRAIYFYQIIAFNYYQSDQILFSQFFRVRNQFATMTGTEGTRFCSGNNFLLALAANSLSCSISGNANARHRLDFYPSRLLPSSYCIRLWLIYIYNSSEIPHKLFYFL